jgi:hypothetical protein
VIGNRQFAAFVLVPSAALQGPDPMIPAGSIRLEVFAPRQPRPVAVETLAQGERRTVVGYEFEFVREVQFSGLQVVSDPSVNVVWIGAALMLLGTISVFYLPLRRVWVRAVPGDGGATIQVASTNPRGVLADREFAELAERIQVATSATRPPTGPPPTIRTPGSATLGPSNLVTDRSSTHSAPTSNALD